MQQEVMEVLDDTGSHDRSPSASFQTITKESIEQFPEVIDLTPASAAGEHLAEWTENASALMVMRRQVKPAPNDDSSVTSYGSVTSAGRRKKGEPGSPPVVKRSSSWTNIKDDEAGIGNRARSNSVGASSRDGSGGGGTKNTNSSTGGGVMPSFSRSNSSSGKKSRGSSKERTRSKSLPSRTAGRRKKKDASARNQPPEPALSQQEKTRNSIRKSMKTVSFSNLQIRLYDREIGDNPSCSSGPPIGIGWKYQTFYTSAGFDESDRKNRMKKTELVISVDKYEVTRGPRRPSHQLVLPRETREEMLLENGVSRGKIADAVRNNVRVKNQRRQTVHNLPFSDMEELMERVGRTFRRMLVLNGERRKHLRSRHMYEDWKKKEKKMKKKGIKIEQPTGVKGILIRKSRIEASRDSGGSKRRIKRTGRAKKETNTKSKRRDSSSKSSQKKRTSFSSRGGGRSSARRGRSSEPRGGNRGLTMERTIEQMDVQADGDEE